MRAFRGASIRVLCRSQAPEGAAQSEPDVDRPQGRRPGRGSSRFARSIRSEPHQYTAHNTGAQQGPRGCASPHRLHEGQPKSRRAGTDGVVSAPGGFADREWQAGPAILTRSGGRRLREARSGAGPLFRRGDPDGLAHQAQQGLEFEGLGYETGVGSGFAQPGVARRAHDQHRHSGQGGIGLHAGV
jgi:hypothetical protein